MRILLHAPGSPDMPTGYARVTADLAPRLAAMGHDVAISANSGVVSHPSAWRGFAVYPCTPYQDFGEDVVTGHYRHFKADVVVTIMCTWTLHPEVWRELKTIHVTPVDCMPMSAQDYRVIWLGGGLPAAVSRFGEKAMRARGLDPVYLPHAVDTGLFRPPPDRMALREAVGVRDRFVVGLNFMNNDRARKAVFHQMKAFAVFRESHPDALLAVHAIKTLPEGLNLPQLADHLKLGGAVMFSPQYELVSGMIPGQAMADWYGMCDVVTNVGNEGFGLPFLEAQACGTPVVYGDWGTGPELVEAGWPVPGQEDWNRVHAAEWRTPLIDHRCPECGHREGIVLAYEEAYEALKGPGQVAMRAAARQSAARYDADTIIPETWGPVLDLIG